VDCVLEPQKRVPVLCDVDVVVAGAGVSGVFAAIAAARNGARTLLVDRFGSVGGNIGPGMICNGALASGTPDPRAGYQVGVYPGFTGIAREFIERHAAAGGESVQPFSPNHYPKDSSIASYVMLQMLQESGVQLALSTCVCDPIMEGSRVRGLFLENKSGRQAVRAAVVVDATGEADVARRAGAPILYPKTSYHALDGHAPTGMGVHFLVARVNWARYDAFMERERADEEDLRWAKQNLGPKADAAIQQRAPMLSCMRRAWEKGHYRVPRIDWLGEVNVRIGRSVGAIYTADEEGLAWGGAAPPRVEELNIADGAQISELEWRLRMMIFECVRFYRDYVPGFEKAYLLFTPPFIGARGGPCIEGEYTLTMEDCRAGRRFDDVVYLYGEFRAIRHTCEQGQCKWVDVPYRVMLPKKVDGLLAVGRSASGIPDTLLRNRMAVKHMGQAGGTAAAIAARRGVSPRELDARELQRALLDAGFYLGSLERLKELGLV